MLKDIKRIIYNSELVKRVFLKYCSENDISCKEPTDELKQEISTTDSSNAITIANNIKHYRFHSWDKEVDISNFIKIPEIGDKHTDNKIIQIIKNAYFANDNVFDKKPKLDVWQLCIVPSHEALITALRNDEDEKARNILGNMSNNETGNGFIHYIEYMDENLLNHPQLKADFKLFYMDVLINFAEWLGVIPIENAEQYLNTNTKQTVYGISLGLDPDEVISLIDKKLGREVIFPEFQPGLHAIKTKRGYFIDVHFIYMYIALRIREILNDIVNPCICEIGGGFGFLPYYLDWVGIKDVTIVDLPSVSVISSYFIIKNLPGRKLLFNYDQDKYNNSEAIKLLTPKYFHEAPHKHYDLVINSRSMPEINREVVLEYLNNIKRVSKMFYSINQEARGVMWGSHEEQKQNCVPELIEEVGGFRRQSRNLFWLQKGHVEELYAINDK
jgi:hypothetical protein